MSTSYVGFYPSDWLAGTRGLTMTEVGVYIQILALIYDNDGPIADDPKRLARSFSMREAAFETVLSGLVESGKLIRDCGFISNERAINELKKRNHRVGLASQKANARWGKNAEKTNDGPMPQHCRSNANQNQNQIENPSGFSSARESARPPHDFSEDEGRGCRLPAEWEPNIGAAVAEGLTEDQAKREAVKFKNHYRSMAGPGALRTDWDAAFSNWCIKAAEWRAQSSGYSSQGPPQAFVSSSSSDLAVRAKSLQMMADKYRAEGDRNKADQWQFKADQARMAMQ